ncbi:MAG: hypothetical protein OEW15_14655 [Nitrospirota bacterium]|nr:hypothetical protein [Nitrospirota bacterium]
MTDLLKTMQAARSFDDLSPLLDDISREAVRMSAAGSSKAGQVREMDAILSEARRLLEEMTRREVRSRGTSRHAAAQFLELDGKIRKIGSVLDRASGKQPA